MEANALSVSICVCVFICLFVCLFLAVSFFFCVGLFRWVSVCVCFLWFLCNCFAAGTGVVETILNLILMSAEGEPLQLSLEF